MLSIQHMVVGIVALIGMLVTQTAGSAVAEGASTDPTLDRDPRALAVELDFGLKPAVVLKLDKHPDDRDLLRRHIRTTDPDNISLDTVKCPGDRKRVDKMFYKTCYRFTLKRCAIAPYPGKGGCFRNEIGVIQKKRNNYISFDTETWMGFSIFTAKEYVGDELKTLHFQLHANGGAEFTPGGPMLALLDQHGMWGLSVRGSSRCNSTMCDLEYSRVEYFAPVVPGEWVDFVLHTKLSYHPEGRGFTELFMNGRMVFSEHGIVNTYNEEIPPYFKFGVYKHHWGEFPLFRDKYGRLLIEKAEAQKYKFQNDFVDFYMNAIVISEGEDKFDEVDTRPHCSNVKDCCETCQDGKPNELYNAFRCEQFCRKEKKKIKKGKVKRKKQSKMSEDELDDLCRAPRKCDNVKECCSMCTKDGESSRKYSLQECSATCMASWNDKELSKFCPFPSLPNNMCQDNGLCQAQFGGATCEQHPQFRSFHCNCPTNTQLMQMIGLRCEPKPAVVNVGNEDDE